MNELFKGALWGSLAGLVTIAVLFATNIGEVANLTLSTPSPTLMGIVMTVKLMSIFAVGGLITGSMRSRANVR